MVKVLTGREDCACIRATTVEESLCLAALTQAFCAKLLVLRERNLGFRKYMPQLIQENKWRATRGGMDARLIDLGKEVEVPMKELAVEILEFVDDVVDALAAEHQAEQLAQLAEETQPA